MAMDFSGLKALDVQDKVARYEMTQITVNGKSPVLMVAPATDANKPYFNALLKHASKATKGARRGQATVDTLQTNRNKLRELYPKYVIRSWEILDENGNAAPYTVEDGQAFVDALPDWVFDDLCDYCSNPANYLEVFDVETTAKN